MPAFFHGVGALRAIGRPCSRFSSHSPERPRLKLPVTGEEAEMSDTRKPWGLLRRIVPQRSIESVPDPGDMGTAFGLDFCLANLESGTLGDPPDANELPDALLRRLFAPPSR
jgi:hypothetical protein